MRSKAPSAAPKSRSTSASRARSCSSAVDMGIPPWSSLASHGDNSLHGHHAVVGVAHDDFTRTPGEQAGLAARAFPEVTAGSSAAEGERLESSRAVRRPTTAFKPQSVRARTHPRFAAQSDFLEPRRNVDATSPLHGRHGRRGGLRHRGLRHARRAGVADRRRSRSAAGRAPGGGDAPVLRLWMGDLDTTMAGLERCALRTEARLGIPHGAMRGLPRAWAGSGSPSRAHPPRS